MYLKHLFGYLHEAELTLAYLIVLFYKHLCFIAILSRSSVEQMIVLEQWFKLQLYFLFIYLLRMFHVKTQHFLSNVHDEALSDVF